MWKVNKSKKDIQIYEMSGALKNEALKQDLHVNLFHILSEQPGEYDKIHALFERAARIAHKSGIELALPSIRPETQRECRFIEDGSMFVSWDGNVSPCYFLWHKYAVMRMGSVKHEIGRASCRERGCLYV